MLACRLAMAAIIWAMAIVATLAGAQGQTLRFTARGDLTTLDPYSVNEIFTLAFQGNLYEGLVSRDAAMAIQPALAESWTIVAPDRWRFKLRPGVRFHNGEPFTADDVLFSATRVRKPGSDLKARLAGVVEITKIDDLTIEVVTERPNPILIAEWDNWYIMSRAWTEAHGAAEPSRLTDTTNRGLALIANGTGPFALVSREPDQRTVARRHDGWWGSDRGNLREVVFQPITSDATRVAALLSGEVDLSLSIPVQDIDRIANHPGTRVLTGHELRTLFLGFDQARDVLGHASVKDRNPLKDRRVRQAFYQAIDVQAMVAKVMRGQATVATTLVAPDIRGFPAGLRRYPYDPAAARALLREAGYPDGFALTLDCPNDRYPNDEQICQAVVGMLARIGIKARLNAQGKTRYFAQVLGQGGYDTSFYLLGWTPSGSDSLNALFNLAHTRDPATGAGAFNVGGYANPALDALSAKIMTETDLARRDLLIRQAWQLLHDDVAYVPLHQPPIAWGLRDGVQVVMRPDDQFVWRHASRY